ncbi:MAG: hypothetical protein KTR31_15860 [Myxococcales bacterium]|nr:hypothetical protein [Myxococcales bacterium]
MWFASIGSAVAMAGTPVVYAEGDAPVVLARVAERTGVPLEQLDPVPLQQVRTAPPEVLGDVVMRRCAKSATDGETIRTDLARAQVAWADRDAATAIDHLDLAVTRLGCLSEVVEAPIAAKAFQLRGALMLADGDDEGARGEFATALALDPELTWGEDLPQEGSVAFAEAGTVQRNATVVVVPPNLPSGPWIDGVEIKQGATLSEGLHLLQYSDVQGIRSAWLSVGGDADLVLPTGFRGPILEGMAEPGRREVLSSLFAAALPDMAAAYVSHQGGLWLVIRDGDDLSTTELSEMEKVEEPVVETKKERKKRLKAERKAARGRE